MFQYCKTVLRSRYCKYEWIESIQRSRIIMNEKAQIFKDVYDGIIPKRVPISVSLEFEVAAQFGNLNLSNMQWNPGIVRSSVEKICQTVFSDVCPVNTSIRLPGMYQFLGSQSYVLSSDGFVQHPEVVGMLEEDYEYLIESPYDCIIERVIPRQFKELGNKNPMMTALSLSMGMKKNERDMTASFDIMGEMIQKYGYFSPPPNSSSMTEAPFDYLSDQLRSFSGISKDVRRHRNEIMESCEALYDFAYRKGLPANPSKYGRVFLPLHMPPFMRTKDFEDLWWPTFKKLIHHYAAQGIHCTIFCEQDWSRYIDYLQELPTNTVIWFEYGDPKIIKEKLGNKFILTGFYPLTSLKTKSKSECLDLAKEYIDILAPGGKYIFGFDKIPVVLSDVNMDTLCSLTEFVRDYAVYDNAGEQSGDVFRVEDYSIPTYRKPESKYFPTFDKYKEQFPSVSEFARDEFESISNSMFQFFSNLIY